MSDEKPPPGRVVGLGDQMADLLAAQERTNKLLEAVLAALVARPAVTVPVDVPRGPHDPYRFPQVWCST